LSDPSQFLSQRALDRRLRQGIALKENDIPVNPAYVDSVKSKGGTIINRSKWFNSVTVQCDSAQLEEIKKLSFVLNTVNIGKRFSTIKKEQSLNFSLIPTEENAKKLRSSRIQTFDYGKALNQIELFNGIPLHNDGYRGQGMLIAVLDAGFRRVDTLHAFDSLWINHQIIGTWDFVTGDSSVFEDDTHGMHVLSTMGGNIPGEIIGTAPKAQYLLLRSENANSEYEIEECNWAAAAEFADSAGADIINSSLGYTTFDFDSPTPDHTYNDLDGNTAIGTIAADLAASKGILVVNSAGNEGGSMWHYIGVPADGDSVLAIGAVMPNRKRTSFSSFGLGNLSSKKQVKPNVMSMGENCAIQESFGIISNNGAGTSFASPILAGMAACLWQANPTKTNMNIFHAIERSADRYNKPDSSYGYGIPDFQKARDIVLGLSSASLKKNQILSYPNPFNENGIYLDFISDSSENIKIDVLNILGQNIYSSKERAYQGLNKYLLFEKNVLNSGIYFIKVTSSSMDLSTKVVRN